jgi:hypothetical protein
MTMLRSTLPLALLALATSCWRSKSPTPQQPDPNPTPGAVDVSIASVTLSDDCNQPPVTVPPPMPAAKQASAPRSAADAPSAGASMSMMEGDRACEQSSVQLRVANGTSDVSKVAIKKIELLDENGSKLRDLTPRDPSLWAENGYVPWDEQVASQSVIQVSYALSAPGASSGGTYTVRVVVTAGDGTDRTIESKLTLEAEASLPPGAVT